MSTSQARGSATRPRAISSRSARSRAFRVAADLRTQLKLEGWRVGTTWKTSLEAIEQFLAATYDEADANTGGPSERFTPP